MTTPRTSTPLPQGMSPRCPRHWLSISLCIMATAVLAAPPPDIESDKKVEIQRAADKRAAETAAKEANALAERERKERERSEARVKELERQLAAKNKAAEAASEEVRRSAVAAADIAAKKQAAQQAAEQTQRNAAAQARIKREKAEAAAAQNKKAKEQTAQQHAAAAEQAKRVAEAKENARRAAQVEQERRDAAAKFERERLAREEATRIAASVPIPFQIRSAFPGGPAMVALPAKPDGFLMGSKEYDSEKYDSENDRQGGPHRVTLAYRLEMGQTEVTVAQYLQCVEEQACSEPEWRETGSKYHYQTYSDDHYRKFGAALTGANYPIIGVSWHNAQQYAKWATIKAGLAVNAPNRFRLPTESEWEYAARAGSSTRWSHGDDESRLQEFAWYGANSGDKTHEVAGRLPNDFRLHDMAGNTWEWVEDCYGNYSNAPANGAAAGSPADTSCSRVLRGGSWGGIPVYLRSADRSNSAPSNRFSFVGFRLARTLLP